MNSLWGAEKAAKKFFGITFKITIDNNENFLYNVY